ncbi:MAG: SusC/RagA family TonB-linked outer membrane protein [Bacteroidota bacterium]
MMKKLLSLGWLFFIGLAIGQLSAQQKVSGVVTDTDGQPVIGASVIEKGTTNGITSDNQGRYSLTVGENATLLFTYIGKATIEEAVSGRSTINVEMKASEEYLDEVIITALGFELKKDETGTTASNVRASDINRSGEVNFLNSLGAKASNVQIARTNGDPGAGSTIRIRGANSVLGSSNPLIILDGIPIDNSTTYGGGNNSTGGRTGGVSQQSRLNDLNPADIESVNILKGASAAALWGARASNGVIVITTKQGAAGRVNINFKSTVSFDWVNQRYDLQDTYGQGRGGSYSPTGAEAWGDYIPDRAGGADEVDQSGQRFVSESGNVYYPITQKNATDTYLDSNWDGVFQTGGFFQNDLTVSGGNNKLTYFLSLGRVDQEGIIRESDYDRTNFRLNNKFFATDWLTIESRASFANIQSNRVQQSSNTAGLLLGLLRTPADFDQSDYIGTYFNSGGESFPLRQRSYRRYLGNNNNPTYNNPLWTINEQTANSTVNRSIFSTKIDITPFDFMKVTLRGGLDTYTDAREYFFPISSAGSRQNGIFSEDLIRRQELNFDAIARGNFQITDDIDLSTTIGWNINDRQRRINNSEIVGFLVNIRKPTTELNSAAESSTIGNSKLNIRSNRGYAVFGFDLYDEVFVTLSGTSEASSTYSRNFFYPAMDAAWQFTDRGDFGVLTFGKLRASWGQVGIAPPAHVAQTIAEGGFTYSTYSDPLDIALYGGGFRLDDDRGNPNLEPAIKTEWEVGTDLRFFKDKLSVGMTYYQNEIIGDHISVELTPSFGFDTQIANAANMENKGFELDLDYQVFRKSDFNMSIYGNWSINRNLVTDLAGTETIDLSGASVSSRAIVGHPLGVLYGTGSQTDDNGNFILDDNGFPQITTSPIILGDPNPDWRGGLGVRLSYKGFQFNVLVEHSQGGAFSPRTLHVLNRFGTTAVTANRVTTDQELMNYGGDVIPAGTTVRGNIEDFGGGPVLLDETWYRTGIGGGFGDNQAYNFSIYDATFTRLRELSIGYVIKSDWLFKKVGIGSVNLMATGRNLFLIDNIPGIDPEINQTGVSNARGLDYFTNPSTASGLFSIIINY